MESATSLPEMATGQAGAAIANADFGLGRPPFMSVLAEVPRARTISILAITAQA